MANQDPEQRHLLVKAIIRTLYKLNDIFQLFAQKIFFVIEPMHVGKDYYARVLGQKS